MIDKEGRNLSSVNPGDESLVQIERVKGKSILGEEPLIALNEKVRFADSLSDKVDEQIQRLKSELTVPDNAKPDFDKYINAENQINENLLPIVQYLSSLVDSPKTFEEFVNKE